MFLFRKKKAPKVRYLTYSSLSAKYRQLLEQLTRKQTTTTVCYFFDETRDQFTQLADALGISWSVASSLDPSVIKICSAYELASDHALQELIVLEPHPLYSTHENLLAAAGAACTTIMHVSMDDALLKTFNQNGMAQVMEKLGLGENDCLEHPMISKSLERAMKAIEARKPHFKDIRTSQQDWYQTNLGNI